MKTQPKKTEVAKKEVVKAQPEVKFKSGSIQATIWKNEQTKEDGEVFENFNFTIERTYLDDKESKEKGSNIFKHTSSMRKRDIASVRVLIEKVSEYLLIDEDEQDLNHQ